MIAIAWALFGLLATVLGVLIASLHEAFQRIDSQGARIDAQGASLGARIDAQSASLGARIDAQGAGLGARIDSLAQDMYAEFRRLDERLSRSGV